MHSKRDKAIELRKAGFSYKEITEVTGISKSTLSYMFKNVKLTQDQKIKIQERGAQKLCEINKKRGQALTEKERMLIGEKVRTRHLKRMSEDVQYQKEVKERPRKAHLQYLQAELTIKKILEEIYECKFEKELYKNVVFDFANKKYLIEHTIDWGKGISSLTSRFRVAKSDGRIKIAYLPFKHFGAKRRSRLEELGVKVIDCHDLDKYLS